MERQLIKTPCDCGGILHQVDHRNPSATLACSTCGRCSLKIDLPDFGELKRMNMNCPRPATRRAAFDQSKRALRGHWREQLALIPLRDFHLKRGDGPGQRPMNDLRMAQQLFECLVWDVWPSPATIADFGIVSARHLAGLQYAARSGITAYDLDRVLGDGPAITRLVQSVPGQRFSSVLFQTLHDNVNWSNAEDDAL